MQSAETGRQSHRRKVDLSINTSASALQGRDAVPRTPPSRKAPQPSKGNLKTMAPRPALRLPHNNGSRDVADLDFLDAATPVDGPNKENDRPDLSRPDRRDSHDLSLPRRQVTRDSLVANMLFSLDQLSMAQMSGPAPRAAALEDQTYGLFGSEEAMGPSIPGPRAGPSGHGYTYSSDLEGADDSSRMSSQISRGRRSNSSSGFQSSLGRINSLREPAPKGSQPDTPGFHTRGSKGSKGSSMSSLETGGYAQVLSSQRWAHGIGGRSSSFDYGNSRTNAANMPPPWHVDFSQSFFNNNNNTQDEYDAAPTPTVPGGPRRLATVPSMPVLAPPEPWDDAKSVGKAPTLERKRSTRSSKSAIVGRRAETKFGSRDAPPVPPLDLDSAPAPHVGYEKSKEPARNGGASTAAQPKDKPGFFRRVFGSSRYSAANAMSHSNTSNHGSAASGETSSRPGSKPGQASVKSTPPSRESHHSTTHTLQKKTSAFFRRRKQSVGDAQREPMPVPPAPTAPVPAVPAVPPLQLPPAKPDLTAAAKDNLSPVTSLRRAMRPYLKDSPLTPDGFVALPDVPVRRADLEATAAAPHSLEDDELPPVSVSPARPPAGFSPGYEPSPSAMIRSVEPEEPDYGEESHPHIETPTRPPPDPPTMARASSFLHDDSDSEDSPPRQRAPSDSLPRVEERDSKIVDGIEPRKFALSQNVAEPETFAEPSTGEKVVAEQPDRPEEGADKNRGSLLALPIEGAGKSEGTEYQSASSVPSLRIEESEDAPAAFESQPAAKPLDEPEFVVGEPTEDDRQKALGIFDGDEDFIQKEKAAAWMGEEGPIRQRTLRAYMELYDFSNQSILQSLRQVCARLVFRAETQQVDRLLLGFSTRWCSCNPNNGFKAADIIHTICFSIMMLNTDLHLAGIEQKMTRSQFVKNTMTTIRQSLAECAPEALDHRRSILPERNDMLGAVDSRTSTDGDRANSWRSSFRPPPRLDTSNTTGSSIDDCGPLVKAPYDGPIRAWEAQVETVLKDIYSSIRDERLPLFGAEAAGQLSVSGNPLGILKRSPSVLSKTPSDGVSSTRGRIVDAARASASRWTSKSRSRPRPPLAGGFASSRTSFDDGNSIWSPTESSANWSRQSLGRTQTSMSMDSFGSTWVRRDYHQSIGFANALSQAIIREDALASPPLPGEGEADKRQPLLDDESLELAGPPWVKEGIVTHKHHLDGIEKKAKDRNWTEVFAVVQKGTLSLFSFSPNKSLRNKSRSRLGNVKGAPVGGGNWQENATSLGCFSLLQTLASTLPPPGYSRQRPNVWALSLPSGAVHLFQVGTPDICREFVNTANYWSARLSTHPLMGGISNIEYGWSDSIINNPLVTAINASTGNLARPGSGASTVGKDGHSRIGSTANAASPPPATRPSTQSRGSTSLDLNGLPGRPGSSLSRGSLAGGGSTIGSAAAKHVVLPGDRIHIAEWTAPTQPLRASAAAEADQRDTLLAYVRSIEDELTAHNALRGPMLLAFSPRGANAGRAMANWQRKSEYLLREAVKFRTYVDALNGAEARRGEIYKLREGGEAEAEKGESEETETKEEVEEEDVTGVEALGVSARGEVAPVGGA